MLTAVAAAAGYEIEALFLGSGAPRPAGSLAEAPTFELLPGVLERVATTQTPQPLLAVVRYRPADRVLLERARFVVAAAVIGYLAERRTG